MEHLQRQPNAWTCGPSALRHALLVHGRRVDVRRLSRLSITKCCEFEGPQEGRCEHGLQNAAKAYGYRVEHVVARDPSEVYHLLREQPVPTLLCTEHHSHWITTLGRATARHIWIADSEWGGKPIMQRLTWRALCRRFIWGLPDETVFHLYPVLERP